MRNPAVRLQCNQHRIQLVKLPGKTFKLLCFLLSQPDAAPEEVRAPAAWLHLVRSPACCCRQLAAQRSHSLCCAGPRRWS